MKLKLCLLAMLLALAPIARGATNDLTGLLQQGLFEEEANRNLDAAISDYQSLASDFDKDRQLAATAIFRLGECYRKLGRTNEAVIQYQRIVKEFSDQPTLVNLSRQNLAGLNVAPRVEENGATQAALLDARANVASLQSQLQEIEKMAHDEKRVFVQQNYPNPVLTESTTQLVDAERDLIKLKTEFTPDHPKYKSVQELVNDLNAKIDAQTEGAIRGLRDKLAAAQAKLNLLRNGQSELTAGEGGIQESSSTDDEQKEIRDIQDMIQNSPDLINAPSSNKTSLQAAATKGQLVVTKYLLDHGADVNKKAEADPFEPEASALFLGAEHGHKAMVELLLAHGADVNGAGGSSPLNAAVAKGFVGVVDVLLANKADVNALNGKNGGHVLHTAILAGNTNVLQLLVDHGADVNAADDGGDSPLHLAASANKPDAVRILIASKADVNARDKEGKTPLHDAAEAGNAKIISLLLGSGANVDATNQINVTPLSYAVALGHVDAVRALLEHKADPNHSGPIPSGPWPSRSYSGPSPPLIIAAIESHRNEILKMLLDGGANPGADTASGYSPLHAAIGKSDLDAVQLLLQHGANPNGPDQSDESPLNAVFSSGRNTRIVQLLLDKGADPNARSHDGLAPLMRTSDPEVARWLIQHKADVNARTAEGATPLMLAARESEEFLKVLLTNGAKLDLQNKNGDTALHYAVRQASTNAVTILLAHGANPNIQNNDGSTPLDLAKTGLANGGNSERITGPGLPPRPILGFSRSVSPEVEQQIADLLVKAGGLANLPKRDRIEVRRASHSSFTLLKGSHDWNRYSLLEVIAGNYGLLSQDSRGEWQIVQHSKSSFWNNFPPFPDFRNVTIYRRTGNSAKQTAMNIDVEDIFKTGDCSRDIWLDWGDVVEIPEIDHPVGQLWDGLSDPDVASLIKCVGRQVTVKIKGESTVLKLAPELTAASPLKLRLGWWALTRPSFMLRSVLDNSKLLRVSSDLSRVKVTRHDPVTKKTVEWVVDCTDLNQSDLWLRDGDVIEVPEK